MYHGMMYSIEFNIQENLKEKKASRSDNSRFRYVSRSVVFIVKQNRTVKSKVLPVGRYSQSEKDHTQPLQECYQGGRFWKEIAVWCQEARGL